MGIQLRDETYYLTSNAGIQHYTELRLCREHRHDFIEFVYILRGRCTHTIDGNSHIVKPGDMLVINYGQKHSIVDGYGEYINIFLKPEYISENLVDETNAFALLNLAEFSDFRETLLGLKNIVTFSDFERSTVENIVTNLEIELKKRNSGFALSAHSWFNILLVMIFRKMSLLQTGRFQGITEELLQYITAHCCEKIEMNQIAAMCHYNPSYFSRVFKIFVGMSFTDYVKKARIELAMQLLNSTSMRVRDVCFAVGYSDATKFYKNFKDLTGMTPFEYRLSMIP